MSARATNFSKMKLEEIQTGASLSGIEVSGVVTVVAAVPIANGTVQLVYRTGTGDLKERLVNRADESSIELAHKERPWSFEADPEKFKLAVEAKRIELAYLFDPMMAVHTSNVEPLPHQITAVYESMLPRQPLRFVLADDPGAGKTIMAGLYMRELVMRADARRILVVSPGSLVEQWRDEMYEKFGLKFDVYSALLEASTPTANPFDDKNFVIARLDQLSRREDVQQKLFGAEPWDLVIFDEAHKLAAHYLGNEIKWTKRFKFAEKLREHTRNLLLMTATPHSGKEEDFQLFLSLLDADRFYGRFRDKIHRKIDATDLMRRMQKEELLRFDGTPLFPERIAKTANYKLSEIERALYDEVTEYVKTEMGKADQIGGQRRGSVGFALTTLQRRLASSPEAIFQSLRRRKERLERRLEEEQQGLRGSQPIPETTFDLPEDEDDLNAEEQESLEQRVVDEATTAKTIDELKQEIETLKSLQEQAREVVSSNMDRKWDELSAILQDKNPIMLDADGRRRKIIIFTEHRDTLSYLEKKIGDAIGNRKEIVTIHGGTRREDRRERQSQFRSNPEVRILIATDAAGEGVNLQNANLMVNYDLPWNPNRLEQRFGRIHRIGQREVCHLWNLVAKETREGDVYHRLLTKLEIESEALQGRVFDILGEVFEETSLKDLLIEAIVYGDKPEVRAQLSKKIDNALDQEKLKAILERNALANETMSVDRLFKVKQDLEKAQARRLQPYFVRSFFRKAFESLGGAMHPREAGRFEITHVPARIRERDYRITGSRRREFSPIVQKYERVCFTKESVQPIDRPNMALASLLHPGHPLMLAVSDIVIEEQGPLLREGAVLVDPSDEGDQPHLLFLMTHEVKAGGGQILSKRLQFVRVAPDGSSSPGGWAPHLDLEPLAADDRPPLRGIMDAAWLQGDLEQRAIGLAANTLVPEHSKEITERHIAQVDKTLNAVNERLSREIDYWTERWMKLRDDRAAGKDVGPNIDKFRRTIDDLKARLNSRKKDLQQMRHVTSATPIVQGGALVVPIGLLRRLRGDVDAGTFSADAEARSRVEKIAMDAVRRVEESRGCRVEDVSAQKCGWDLTSYPPTVDGAQPEARHIEVKGRVRGATTITISRNEILYALNQADKFVLAVVLVGEDDSVEGPFYAKPDFREPAWGEASVNFNLSDLLKRAELQTA